MAWPLYFAPAMTPHGFANHISSSSFRTSNKRKRDSIASNENPDGQARGNVPDLRDPSVVGDSSNAQTSSLATSAVEVFNPDATYQYEIFGRARYEAVAQVNFPRAFPHSLADDPKPRIELELIDELAQLQSPLQIAASLDLTETTAKVLGLRQRHQRVLTSMMHKCLLESDYVRAGRAWGMLLRAEHGGRSFDPRSNARWGLGAEVLFQRQIKVARSDFEVARLSKDGVLNNQHLVPMISSLKDAKQAKDYYERLILQYPLRKFAPNVTGPHEFYLATFGLWIYTVKEHYSLSVAVIDRGVVGGADGKASNEEEYGSKLSKSDLSLFKHRQRESVRQHTLHGALEIALRLHEMLKAPPYSDNADLWELLGMVYTWVGSLSIVIQFLEIAADGCHNDDYSALEIPSTPGSLNEGKVVDDSASNKGHLGREQALVDAQIAFEKAERCRKARK